MLDRPRIEFIHAQILPWRCVPLGAARPDAQYKFLSRDPADGACSCLIRYPAGWSREGDECLTADEEFYVLEGELVMDGTRYAADSYALLPAGWPRHEMRVPHGAVVLTFFNRQPDFAPATNLWLTGRAAGRNVSWRLFLAAAAYRPWTIWYTLGLCNTHLLCGWRTQKCVEPDRGPISI